MVEEDKAWIGKVADLLEQAEADRSPIDTLDKLGLHDPAMPMALAYSVQDELRRRRLAAGSRHVGFKVAVTTRRKLRAMDLAAPIVGFLCGEGAVHDGAEVDLARLIRPRIEPEIAFLLGETLQGPGCTAAHVMAATRCVAPAFEIIDSRYVPGAFHVFSAVADNVSTARHVVGAGLDPAGLELGCMGTAVRVNGELVATGASTQVLGHPAIAVAELVNVLATRGQALPAGAMVLSGGIVEAFPFQLGDTVSARFQGLGDVTVRGG